MGQAFLCRTECCRWLLCAKNSRHHVALLYSNKPHFFQVRKSDIHALELTERCQKRNILIFGLAGNVWIIFQMLDKSKWKKSKKAFAPCWRASISKISEWICSQTERTWHVHTPKIPQEFTDKCVYIYMCVFFSFNGFVRLNRFITLTFPEANRRFWTFCGEKCSA